MAIVNDMISAIRNSNIEQDMKEEIIECIKQTRLYSENDIRSMMDWMRIYARKYDFSLSYEIDKRFLTVYILDEISKRTTMHRYDYHKYTAGEIEIMLENFMFSERSLLKSTDANLNK